jgi:hypothetical protein
LDIIYLFSCLTDWLSGSGGTGETLHIIAPFLANRACARAAEPLFAACPAHFAGEPVLCRLAS